MLMLGLGLVLVVWGLDITFKGGLTAKIQLPQENSPSAPGGGAPSSSSGGKKRRGGLEGGGGGAAADAEEVGEVAAA